ncbi:response regulator transcription factor [Pseudomonas sp. NPDC090202]|uniref:response regulator transcription factor n=1 Tax=unclassified Pseudomonas TaxID=196821 RepID=UPI0038098098
MVTRPVIAIIDDDENVRISLSSLLRSYGYMARLYDSAEDFLAADNIAGLHCLVSDIQMPGKSGLQMYQQLLAQGIRLPVIFITASSDQAPRLLAEQLGAKCYLPKPFDGEDLIGCLRVALKEHG